MILDWLHSARLGIFRLFRPRPAAFCATLILLAAVRAAGGETGIISLRDFHRSTLKEGGFTLAHQSPIHILARGAGKSQSPFASSAMSAYGWIINASTREPVWTMQLGNTHSDGQDRTFDGTVVLPAGSYEAYFTVTPLIPIVNIPEPPTPDARKKKRIDEDGTPGFLRWLESLFGDRGIKDWSRRSRNWGMDISTNENPDNISTFIPPLDPPHLIFSSAPAGNNEHIRERLVVSRPVTVTVYALGEMVSGDEPVDRGWITNARTRETIWEMRSSNVKPAGGADKNVMLRSSVAMKPGEYILTYITDDSHSYPNWNAAPPTDPLLYGISVMAGSERDREAVAAQSETGNETNVIVRLTRVGNNENRSSTFTLKEESSLHIYAIGELSNNRHQMADYGWIINSRTRERVWSMDPQRTEPAGGAAKNRLIDEIITLPAGTYTVFYQSDDSHAYDDWNDDPPYDPEHWGITVYGAGEHFIMSNVVTNTVAPAQEGVIAQIVQVHDNENLEKPFHLDRPTRIKIYALGEGRNGEMYDYGWIDDAASGRRIWEMTYGMTFHAGGDRKNREVSATLMLDKGDYNLHYVSDDSHSYNRWNADPPDDPAMWGITLTYDR